MAETKDEHQPQPPPPASPATYDWLIKSSLRRFYPELAAWLVGERPESVEALDTAHQVAAARFSDKLLCLRFRDKPAMLLHVEFQMEGSLDMPRRMAEYLAFVLKTLELAEKEGVRPACVVVYLHKDAYRHDPGYLEILGYLEMELRVRYKVIKLWEIPPESILALESPGLCPFLPLLRGRPEDLVIKSVERIQRAPEVLASAERISQLSAPPSSGVDVPSGRASWRQPAELEGPKLPKDHGPQRTARTWK